MTRQAEKMRAGSARPKLSDLFFVLVIVLFIFLDAGLFLFFFVVIIFVFGDDDEMHGMRLGHFQLDVALRAAEDFAFLDFVFVQINFGVAFRTSGHEISLLPGCTSTGGLLYTAAVKRWREGMRKGDGAARISGETAGGSGRCGDCGRSGTVDSARLATAGRRMVDPWRHVGAGRDV